MPTHTTVSFFSGTLVYNELVEADEPSNGPLVWANVEELPSETDWAARSHPQMKARSHREMMMQPQLTSVPGAAVQLTVHSHTSSLPSLSPFLPTYKVDIVGLKLRFESCILATIVHHPK